MELNLKIKSLREAHEMTQEQVAEALYVSRRTVAKWEKGRSYPSIDSLKNLAKCFGVPLEELIDSEEIIALAKADIKESHQKYMALVCSLLDLAVLMMLFVPVFHDLLNGAITSAPLFRLHGVAMVRRVLFRVVVLATAANGVLGLAVSHADRAVWRRYPLAIGTTLSIVGAILFIVSSQTNAALFYMVILIIKGALLVKTK
ncbi:MAG: helix-turn-helix transcriptional regulator [Lachnospiraceae bacterium]|nr:helix-turn-helix transcriptional regulator [Lachnospiraceae bacterium]